MLATQSSVAELSQYRTPESQLPILIESVDDLSHVTGDKGGTQKASGFFLVLVARIGDLASIFPALRY